jgi:hypothetical protein
MERVPPAPLRILKGEKGDKGDPGDPGAGISFLGVLDLEADLPLETLPFRARVRLLSPGFTHRS